MILKNRNNSMCDHKIFFDQTPTQRNVINELSADLSQRQKNGKTDLIINYIKGTPKIINNTITTQTSLEEEEHVSHLIADTYEQLLRNKTSLNFFYANARSIMAPGKFYELKCILKAIPTNIHLIILKESWIKSEEDAGGGVSIFVHNDLKHNLIGEQYIGGNNYLWVHINKHNLNVGLEFIETYGTQLHEKKRAIIFGDFNLDLLHTSPSIRSYKELVAETGFSVLNKIDANYCTREKTTRKSVIDHICTNIRNNEFHMEKSTTTKTKILYPPQEDWINKKIIDRINARNIPYQKFKQDETNENLKNIFYEERNKLAMKIKTFKSKYYTDSFKRCTKQHKKMWNLINKISKNKVMNIYARPKLMNLSGTKNYKNDICECFNDFLSSISTILSNNIPQKYHNNPSNLLTQDSDNTQELLKLNPCTNYEVSSIIDKLDTNVSKGLDGITVKMI
ncbi:putative tick transposon, partial [Operophtera brumata]